MTINGEGMTVRRYCHISYGSQGEPAEITIRKNNKNVEVTKKYILNIIGLDLFSILVNGRLAY